MQFNDLTKEALKELTYSELELAIDELESTMRPSWVHFAWEYSKTNNGLRSAIAAGFAEKSAHVQANRLLKTDKVKLLLLMIKKKLTSDVRIDAEWVLRQLIAHATADRTEAFTDEGMLKPISEWPEHLRKTVTDISTAELTTNNEPIGELKKMRTTDQLRAIELIGKHTGVQAFSDSIKVEAGDALLAAIQRGRKRARGSEE